MSHSRRVPEGAKPFLDRKERTGLVGKWKKQVDQEEHRNYLSSYTAVRREGGLGEGTKGLDIANLHKVSFLNKVIPELLQNKKKGQKVVVLDIGTGVGDFSEQIRGKFRERVKVFSTGLKKRFVKLGREEYWRNYFIFKKKYPGQCPPDTKLLLDNNELKWRSILELSDFPEFDLIIETFGEIYYSTTGQPNNDGKKLIETIEGVDKLRRYLLVLSKKLLPGGYGSIYPVEFSSDLEKTKDFFTTQFAAENRISIAFPCIGENILVMRKPLPIGQKDKMR